MQSKNIIGKLKMINLIKKAGNTFLSKTFFIYVVLGGLATIVDWGSYALGIYYFEWYYVLAVTISFVLGSITNFLLNKYLNFKNEYKKIHFQFLIYMTIAMIGLAITVFLMWLFIEIIGINKFISRVITTAITLIYNFLGHRFITFRLFR